MKPRIRRIEVLAAAAAFLLGLGVLDPAPAHANAKVVKQVRVKNQQAMENYDLLEYEDARRLLNEAVGIAKRSGLKDPVVARTYLNLAIVYFSGFGDEESAKVALIDAVQIDPSIEIEPAYRTSELARLLSETREEFGSDAPPVGAAVDCDGVLSIEHTLVDRAQAGAAREISVLVSPDVQAAKVSLFYRSRGKADFAEVPMRKNGDCEYGGAIPADAVTGDAVHYYVAAFNKGGKVVASRGSSASPNIIEVVKGGGGSSLAADGENPLGGGGGRTDITTVSDPTERTGPRLYVLIPIGSGAGLITSGETEQESNPVSTGLAPSLLNLAPEVGYYFKDNLAVAFAFRMGFPLGANIMGHATGAPAGLLRVRYGLSESLEGLHFSGSIGGGVMRQTVKVENAPPDMDTDTFVSGPFLLGAGVAYWRTLGGPMMLVAELHSTAGMPLGVEELGSCPGAGCIRPNFALQFDVNLGILFAF
jgi:hypothetical protein